MAVYSGIYKHWEGVESDANTTQEIRELVFLSGVNALRFKDCASNYHYFYGGGASGLWEAISSPSSGIIYRGGGYVGVGEGLVPLTKFHIQSQNPASATARTLQMEVVDNTADSAPEITLFHDNESGTPSSGFLVGSYNFQADNTNGTLRNYARTRAFIEDPTNNSERGKYTIDIAKTAGEPPETMVEVYSDRVNISGDIWFKGGSAGKITTDSEWLTIETPWQVASGVHINGGSMVKISVDSGDILIGNEVDSDDRIYMGDKLELSKWNDIDITSLGNDVNISGDSVNLSTKAVNVGQNYEFTVYLTGNASNPSATAYAYKLDDVVVMHIPELNAIATSSTVTLSGIPAALQTNTDVLRTVALPSFQDNGTWLSENVYIAARAEDYFNITRTSGLFASSGSRSMPSCCITYLLTR